MIKIKAIYDKTKFNHYTENYKIANTNIDNSTTIGLVGSCKLENELNQDAIIQFNNIKIHNILEQYWTVTENISIQFSDNTALFGLNYYKSTLEDGTYESGNEYTYNIISGTGKFVGYKGTVKIFVNNNIRNLTIKINNC